MWEQKNADGILAIAQRQRDSGNEQEAARILQNVGRDVSELAPRAINPLLDAREAHAAEKYRTESVRLVSELQITKGLTHAEATEHFNTSEMADSLRKQVNRGFHFDPDRPI